MGETSRTSNPRGRSWGRGGRRVVAGGFGSILAGDPEMGAGLEGREVKIRCGTKQSDPARGLRSSLGGHEN